jgi:SAM-dependent methyltransferase
MTDTLPAAPSLEDYFRKASLLRLAWRRQPYDFLETHRLGNALFGHDLDHVNLGLWDRSGVDPGQALVERVANGAGVQAGNRLLDLGAGLGEAAAFLCASRNLDSVIGINKNNAQVAYANALTASRGLQDRVAHVLGDAARVVADLPAESVDSAIAVESLGVLSKPENLLGQLKRVLVPGGGFAACLNVQRGELSLFERLLVRRTFGFVPATRETWHARLHTAGFQSVSFEDLTDKVLVPACEHGLQRLERMDPREWPGWILRHTHRLLTRTRDATAEGKLGYELIVARTPRLPAAAGTIGPLEEKCG